MQYTLDKIVERAPELKQEFTKDAFSSNATKDESTKKTLPSNATKEPKGKRPHGNKRYECVLLNQARKKMDLQWRQIPKDVQPHLGPPGPKDFLLFQF